MSFRILSYTDRNQLSFVLFVVFGSIKHPLILFASNCFIAFEGNLRDEPEILMSDNNELKAKPKDETSGRIVGGLDNCFQPEKIFLR